MGHDGYARQTASATTAERPPMPAAEPNPTATASGPIPTPTAVVRTARRRQAAVRRVIDGDSIGAVFVDGGQVESFARSKGMEGMWVDTKVPELSMRALEVVGPASSKREEGLSCDQRQPRPIQTGAASLSRQPFYSARRSTIW